MSTQLNFTLNSIDFFPTYCTVLYVTTVTVNLTYGNFTETQLQLGKDESRKRSWC